MTNEDLTRKISVLSETMARQSEQIRQCREDISDAKRLAVAVQKLATSVEILVRGQNSLENKVDELAQDMNELKARPVKRWERVVEVVISVVVTAVVTYWLAKTGLK